jgi:hypothetical protein
MSGNKFHTQFLSSLLPVQNFLLLHTVIKTLQCARLTFSIIHSIPSIFTVSVKLSHLNVTSPFVNITTDVGIHQFVNFFSVIFIYICCVNCVIYFIKYMIKYMSIYFAHIYMSLKAVFLNHRALASIIPGPRLIEKIIYQVKVWQRLRTTALKGKKN